MLNTIRPLILSYPLIIGVYLATDRHYLWSGVLLGLFVNLLILWKDKA
jgi:hypothetical protein